MRDQQVPDRVQVLTKSRNVFGMEERHHTREWLGAGTHGHLAVPGHICHHFDTFFRTEWSSARVTGGVEGRQQVHVVLPEVRETHREDVGTDEGRVEKLLGAQILQRTNPVHVHVKKLVPDYRPGFTPAVRHGEIPVGRKCAAPTDGIFSNRRSTRADRDLHPQVFFFVSYKKQHQTTKNSKKQKETKPARRNFFVFFKKKKPVNYQTPSLRWFFF